MMIFSISLVAVLFVTACDSNTNTNTITVIGEESANIQAIRTLKGEYESVKKQPVDILGYTFEESFEKANVDFASQTGRYDIVMQYNFSLSSFVRNNYVYPLDSLKIKLSAISDTNFDFEADLFPNVWKELGYYYTDEKHPDKGIASVGYPFAANTMLMTYNKEMFEDELNKKRYQVLYGKELIPPTTWADYKQIAAFFTDKERNTYGVAMQGSASGWLYYEWTNFAFGMGDGVSRKTRGWEGGLNVPITVNTEKNIAATQLFVDLRPYNKGSFFDVDGTLQAELMKEGNVAMSLMWIDYLFPAFTDKNGVFDKRFGFTVIPGNTSMIAGGSFFINRKSRNPEAAFKFVTWLLQKDNQVEMVKNGLASPLKSVYSDPRVQGIPYIHALEESLERGSYFLEAGPDSDLISQTLSEFIQKAWKGDLTVPQALEQAQQIIDNERPAIFKAIL
ncbi:MAG: extracellular solute-binding protein [Saprospiraceae bacterium]|nr:extracellular solute-binding protein [Saprospiraceae bacterium]